MFTLLAVGFHGIMKTLSFYVPKSKKITYNDGDCRAEIMFTLLAVGSHGIMKTLRFHYVLKSKNTNLQ